MDPKMQAEMEEVRIGKLRSEELRRRVYGISIVTRGAKRRAKEELLMQHRRFALR